jgi:uroporphyrinogen decarboxylase
VTQAIEAPFLHAAARQPTPVTPVWFMRQAGRYMPEYRAIRARNTLLQICAQPDLAAEVTLQPVRQLGVDAAILFADILLPLVPMGLDLEFVAGEGPRIAQPVRSAGAVEALRVSNVVDELEPVMQAIRTVRRELSAQVPLIGFAGAPFTVATYAVEGGPARHVVESKRLMYGEPTLWHRLLERLSDVTVAYLTRQVEAGAQAVQLFDSWAGQLSAREYREFVLPHSRSVLSRLDGLGVPRIHFAVGADHLLETMAEAGGEVMGLDWRTSLTDGFRRLDGWALQGNLDPLALFAPRATLLRLVDDVLAQADGHVGHIFNLGHGILPQTPVDNVRAVVERVHEHRARSARA